jgi:predicted Zn-dependent protease
MDEPSWLEKARGYIDLGMFDEASKVVASLPEERQKSPEAKEMQIVILLDRQKLEEAFTLSRDLAESDPENHAGFIQGAYALHAMNKTQAAIDFLQTGPHSLRDDQCYFYNLACYELALGRSEAALTWLTQSIQLDSRNRTRALNDPDLKSLRDQIPGKVK